MQSLQRSIVLTVSYSDQFDFPLTQQEIFDRLLNSDKNIDKSIQISIEDLVKKLADLVDSSLLEQVGEYYCLPSRSSIVASRSSRAAVAARMWKELDTLKRLLPFVPWLSGVYVTGSLAVNNTPVDDDYDFLVIAQNNRLWLVRPVLFILATVYGKARHFGKEKPRSWCFNLWLEENTLEIATKRQSVYTAYEVLQAVPLWTRPSLDGVWLAKNVWTAQYLPNLFLLRKMISGKIKATKNDRNFLVVFSGIVDFFGLGMSLLNRAAFVLQKLYMMLHLTTEEVTYHRAFFHPADTRNIVGPRWKNSLQKTYDRI